MYKTVMTVHVNHSVSHCDIQRGGDSIDIETCFTTYIHTYIHVHMYKYPISYHELKPAAVKLNCCFRMSGSQRKPGGRKEEDCK